MADIVALTHPISQEIHPTWGSGHRWAVHAGRNYGNLQLCLNAGSCQSIDEAKFLADRCAATAIITLRMVKIRANLVHENIDYDPIPADGDEVKIVNGVGEM